MIEIYAHEYKEFSQKLIDKILKGEIACEAFYQAPPSELKKHEKAAIRKYCPIRFMTPKLQ